MAHLLNCLLGTGFNQNPQVEVDQSLAGLYTKASRSFEAVTPTIMAAEIEHQVSIRFNYRLQDSWRSSLKHLQILREIAVKLGLQLEARDYSFSGIPDAKGYDPETLTNGTSNPSSVNGHVVSNGKRKKKAVEHSSPVSAVSTSSSTSQVTFYPNDIVNIVPVVKEASPRVSQTPVQLYSAITDEW